ncbi:MAG: hypothetical protein ACJ765_04290 [Chloroflexota bacterium]
MDQRVLQLEYRVRHEHADGSWGDMVEEPPHDAAAHDPERRWSAGRIFRCSSCGAIVTLTPGEQTPPPDAE